jgi:hypothetical protein
VRLIYYSLANSPGTCFEWQWIQSIRSLRRYNATVPVWLFLYNGASEALLAQAAECRVHVQFLGDYKQYMQRAHARGSVLALYPTLHKFLSLAHGPLDRLAQVLFLDCDTFFFGNAERLFDLYSSCQWYAREEPGSLRSPHGCDPTHIDERLLEHITRCRGWQPIVPFNSGVCLLNHGIWNNLEDLRAQHLDFVWRLLCGREFSGPRGMVHDTEIQHAVFDAATEIDHRRALPYPSTNTWIIEQIALWLALACLPRFSQGLLSRHHVCQGGEFHEMLDSGHKSIVAHYFNGNEREFFRRFGSSAC